MEKIKLELEKPVVLYPQIARALGGISEAIYFQQLYYWHDKGKRDDGWIYKTKKEIEEETTLTRDQQDRIRTKLVKMGVLETKIIKANGSPTLHYKINFGIVENTLLEKRETRYSNSGKPAIPLTENTTENTTISSDEESTPKINTKQENKDWTFVGEIEKIKENYYKKDKNRNHAIIAHYLFDAKKMDFRSKEAFTKYFKRCLAPAKILSDYSDQEIKKIITYCQREYGDKWTLETVAKKAPEVIKKNNSIW